MRIAICSACMPPMVTKKRSGSRQRQRPYEPASCSARSPGAQLRDARAARCRRSRPSASALCRGLDDEARRRQIALADPERDQPLPAAPVVEHLDDAAVAARRAPPGGSCRGGDAAEAIGGRTGGWNGGHGEVVRSWDRRVREGAPLCHRKAARLLNLVNPCHLRRIIAGMPSSPCFGRDQASVSPGGEKVADFGQQHLLVRWARPARPGAAASCAAHAVDALDHQEQHPGDDQEVDDAR